MFRRIELDRSLPPTRVPARVLNEMASHARDTLPEECCGLVVGAAGERYQRVFRCRNDMTALHERDAETYPRDGREAFHMNEHDYMDVMRRTEDADRKVTAVYHSHVNVGCYFSELDQEYASQSLFPFPAADHLVLSLVDGKLEAGVFRREGPSFVGCLMRAEGS